MAGTRLWIQGTVLWGVLFLATLAAYFGLCRTGDVSCRAVLSHLWQDRRDGDFRHATDQWVSRLASLNLPKIAIDQSRKDAISSLWTPVSEKRHTLTISLMIESNVDWQPWGVGLSHWIQDEATTLLDQYPCLSGSIETDLLVAFASNKISQGKTTSNSTASTFGIASRDFLSVWNDVVTKTHRRQVNHMDRSSLNMVLYIPSQVPLYIVNGNPREDLSWSVNSTAMMAPNLVVGIVQNLEPDTASDYDSIVRDAMNEMVHLFLREYCMVWPPTFVPNDALEEEYAVNLYLRHIVEKTHQRVFQDVIRLHKMLLSLPPTVDLSLPIEQWYQLVKMLEEAMEVARKEEWMTALDLLERTETTARALWSSPDLLEPLVFAFDHYLAVFAPLLFPLLLPFVGGMLREIKRYRDKKKKKKALQKATE